MVRLSDIHSLTGFLRNHKAHLKRLAMTGRPEVLTLNGKARVVIQDARAYQKLVDAADLAQSERIVGERLASVDRGEKGVPAAEVLAELRGTLGLGNRRP